MLGLYPLSGAPLSGSLFSFVTAPPIYVDYEADAHFSQTFEANAFFNSSFEADGTFNPSKAITVRFI